MLFQSRFAGLVASLLLGANALVVTATAQTDADPPSRVARLSYLSGNVSFAPAGENAWGDASLNRPLISGDRLWVDSNSRTELQVGAAVLRLDESSGFNFLNLDDRTAQIELTQGTLNLRVSRIYGDQVYEVDTPTLAFVVSRVGEYRFDVDANGQATTVTVFDGAGDVYGENDSRFSVEDHQSVRFDDNELRDYQISDLPQPDAFDRFCSERDRRQEHSISHEYVSEEVIGASDLDDNGDWQPVPEYGHVWFPTHVSVGWAPYRNGHWAWVDPWGWTWVDAASWGFAPFHYGRWAYIESRWGWIPGPVNVRPIYAPALVAFVGGRGWSVGISGGQPVGWFPLGPREVFVPGYHVSHNYFNDVNIRNTQINHNVNITNIYNNYSNGNININQSNYAYRNVPHAVTAVPGNVFTNARPVAAATIRMERSNLERAQVASIAGIAPNRASLIANGAAKNAPPAEAFQRQVIARTAPPARIAPFAQRQSWLQENAGKTAAVPRYLPATSAMPGSAPRGTNVRVIPQATSNAEATPSGGQIPSHATINSQRGAHSEPVMSNNQAPMRSNNLPTSQREDRSSNARLPIAIHDNDTSDAQNRMPYQQGNSTGNRLQDRPLNARMSATPRNNADHAMDNEPNHTRNNDAAISSPHAINQHADRAQDNGEPAQRTNRRNDMLDNAVRDHSSATHNNTPVQNNYAAPSRVQPTMSEPINNPNAIHNQAVQQQPQTRSAPPVQPRNAVPEQARNAAPTTRNEPPSHRTNEQKDQHKTREY